MNRKKFPGVGDLAPAFEAQTTQGTIHFPEYSAGQWCIIFAHPANFSSAWEMFSTFVAMKERWLSERNIKVIGIANVPVEQNDWAQKASRFVGIYLRGPVVEDLDCSIAKRYGIASARRPLPDCNRLALVIDPQGIIRLIIQRPLMPNIESALSDIERELNRLQGHAKAAQPVLETAETLEHSDIPDGLHYRLKPAYFSRKRTSPN